MDEDDVLELTYEDVNGTTKSLTKYKQKLLRWLIGYVRDNIDSCLPSTQRTASQNTHKTDASCTD
jgi:hypothetical protein